MTQLITQGSSAKVAIRVSGLFLMVVLMLMGLNAPAFAQRCNTNDNGETVCCDNSGNCYKK